LLPTKLPRGKEAADLWNAAKFPEDVHQTHKGLGGVQRTMVAESSALSCRSMA
jgi:hypothetical protein